MSIISARDLTKVYSMGDVEVRALRGVSLSIEAGEFVSVIGPSGSGKSTFMHIVGCLDRPTSGQYMLDGRDVSRLSRDELATVRNKKIGFVFQAYNLLSVLTAEENVAFILQLQGVSKSVRAERARETLAAVGLADLRDRLPGDMSGGQQQRVAIARAIAADPVLLLADEPSANLDSQTTTGLLELLRHLNEDEGMTIVTATHDPMVMAYAKRQVHLRDGAIVV